MDGRGPERAEPVVDAAPAGPVGIRSISLAVDVTNYVMLELGQPMHAFDRHAVTGPDQVRRAREGEKLDHARRRARELSDPTTC